MATKKTAAKRSKSNTVSVNFDGVEAGGGSVLLPEGPTLLEVEEATEEESSSGNPMISVKFRVVEGKYEGKPAYANFSLLPQALFNLRGFLEAAGVEIPEGDMDLDLEELVGLTVIGEVVHDDYKGKPKTKLAGFTSVDEAEAEEEEPKKPAKKVTKKAAAEEEDDEPAFKLKQKVKFKDGKKWVTGTVTAIDEDVITVKASDGDEYEMGAEDLEAA